MNDERRKGSQHIAKESVDTLSDYLAVLRLDGRGLPSRNGKVSPSVIALVVGIDRQVLSKNSPCHGLLETAIQGSGLAGIKARVVFEKGFNSALRKVLGEHPQAGAKVVS